MEYLNQERTIRIESFNEEEINIEIDKYGILRVEGVLIGNIFKASYDKINQHPAMIRYKIFIMRNEPERTSH